MWTVSFLPDPLVAHHRQGQDPSSITHARIALQSLIIDAYQLAAFQEGGRGSRVALADIAARRLLEQRNNAKLVQGEHYVVLEPLDKALLNQRRRKAKSATSYPPYILERTDFWCSETELHIMVRITETSTESEENIREQFVKTILTKIFDPQDQVFSAEIMANVACVAFQQRLRSQLTEMKVVAFIADGSILPRKSGASMAPMASPPAIPFKAPADSTMSQDVKVDMGALCRYLPSHPIVDGSTIVSLSGLVVPAGVTLIVGGGYHGKSTLLQTVAAGVYDKIPGDGREYCVAVQSTVSVRAEDGRYVNNCNVSAFISNLPTLPGVTKVLDTQHFSTRDASGSTSQAANVSEAIEMGASALLVDEDISAANFMARDGRMRAMVMDESITPLLYRVNGLYNSFGISSVVVVGGVGDWLDVPHNVILLDKYVAFDATKKAASISYQFSHGHVQYAGRGVVHRLEWDKKGTPIPRRPADTFSKKYNTDVVVSVLDGGHAISLHKEEDEADEETMIIDDDEDEGCIDASRFEQLLDRRQLYGCGLCVAWLLQAAPKHPNLGFPDLLKNMDEALDQGGVLQLYIDVNGSSPETHPQSLAWKHLVEYVGFATRPRTFEAGQALTRMRGIEMEELPVEEDEADLIAQREVDRKKKELAAMWAARRPKSSGSS